MFDFNSWPKKQHSLYEKSAGNFLVQKKCWGWGLFHLTRPLVGSVLKLRAKSGHVYEDTLSIELKAIEVFKTRRMHYLKLDLTSQLWKCTGK
jgi:hypothetical protein